MEIKKINKRHETNKKKMLKCKRGKKAEYTKIDKNYRNTILQKTHKTSKK